MNDEVIAQYTDRCQHFDENFFHLILCLVGMVPSHFNRIKLHRRQRMLKTHQIAAKVDLFFFFIISLSPSLSTMFLVLMMLLDFWRNFPILGRMETTIDGNERHGRKN